MNISERLALALEATIQDGEHIGLTLKAAYISGFVIGAFLKEHYPEISEGIMRLWYYSDQEHPSDARERLEIVLMQYKDAIEQSIDAGETL